MFSGWVNKLKAWVSGEAGDYDWDEAHAKYLSFLTPGPFQRAVAGGDVELVREMLARGEDPNELDGPAARVMGDGLELAGGLNAIECAMAMLNHRRRPEDADAVRDLYACIELCLDAGALPDGPTTGRARGNTPLSLAVELGRPEFVRLFLSAGADPNVQLNPRTGNTILHQACSSGGNRAATYEIVRLLLAAGADHRHPFIDALTGGYHRLWPLFLQAGANPAMWKIMKVRPEEPQRYEYLRTVYEAGGFKAYEKAHARALAATLAKKFPAHIPEEIFPRVVAFWAHAGFYVSAAAVAALPRDAETTNPASWSGRTATRNSL